MDQQPSLPRFRRPPVSEVVIGVQFQSPILTPVHLGLYYQKIKDRFPHTATRPPLPPVFESFETVPTMMLSMPADMFQPRMWFSSADGFSLVQLQSGRLNFN